MQTIIQAVTVKQTKSGIEEVGIMVHSGQHTFFIRGDGYALDHKQIETVILSRGMYNELDDLLNEIQAEHQGLLVNGTWYDYDEFKYVFHKNILDVTEVVLDLNMWDGTIGDIVEETGENISAVEMADFIADWDFTMYETYEIMQTMGLTNHMIKLESENQTTFTADEIVKNYNVWYDEIY